MLQFKIESPVNMRTLALILSIGIAPALAPAADNWQPLFNGKNLEGWESVGDGLWTVMRDGTLLGQRKLKSVHQAWLYTKKEYTNFDLELEYWTRYGGNSGVSIRDSSRGKYSVGSAWVADKTPSHIGYEIQIISGEEGHFPTGSIYLFQAAPAGQAIENDWNRMTIESRPDRIRVKLNGKQVAEHAGDPGRPKSGPIGLQLHDGNSVVMFRNIRMRVVN